MTIHSKRWTQNQYFQLAAFFSAVGMKPGFDSDEQIVYLKREDSDFLHPKTNKPVEPEFLLASAGMPEIGSYGDSRAALAEWLTSEKNPTSGKRSPTESGAISSVEGSSSRSTTSEDPTLRNPALMDALEEDFIRSGFDLQHLVRTIVSSRTYQSAMETNEWNAGDSINFSPLRAAPARAESLLDAMTIATGSRPDFPEVPDDFTAQQLPDPHVGRGRVSEHVRPAGARIALRVRAAQRPQPAAGDEPRQWPDAGRCDRQSRRTNRKGDPGGPVQPGNLIEELYVSSLARYPTGEELDSALTYLASSPGRAAKAQDLLWALINSNAFLFNR